MARTHFFWRLAALATLTTALVGCGEDAGSSACTLERPQPGVFKETLSEYCFFQGNIAEQIPSEGVIPYDVNTVLYSDHSSKFRFIVLPEGEKIEFHDTDHWKFPVGTTLVKSFYFPKDARDPSKGNRIVETRLMVMLGEGDWDTHTYRWNDEQTEATSFLVGTTIDVSWVDETGEAVDGKYRIPSKNDCRNCHQDYRQITEGGVTQVVNRIAELGPRTRQLNRLNDFGDGPVNQLKYYEQLGMFTRPIPEPSSLPTLIDPKDDSQPLDLRARTYLEGNCAHCHNPGGAARNSALFLNIEERDPTTIGICKHPVAAGRGAGTFFYDIVPGKPEESIMPFRMNSMDPEIKMPEIPQTTIDHFGVELISEWIRQMDGDCPPIN